MPQWLAKLLPFERAIGVTIRFHSGARIRFSVAQMSIDVSPFGKLTGYRWAGARDEPLYLDPARIESIDTYPVLRTRSVGPDPQPDPGPLDLTETLMPHRPQ